MRGIYHSLFPKFAPMPPTPSADALSVWRKYVPLKISVFVGRLFRDRLPTKDNLYQRRIFQEDAQLCISGCGMIESTDHIFLHCDVFGQVWQLVHHW